MASLPNKRFVAADGDGVLKVWRADIPSLALTCLQTLRGHARAAFCLAALPDGRIVSGSMDRTLRFWAPVGTQIDRPRGRIVTVASKLMNVLVCLLVLASPSGAGPGCRHGVKPFFVFLLVCLWL